MTTRRIKLVTLNDTLEVASLEAGPHAEIVPCANACGAFYVTGRDTGPKIWTCPACDDDQQTEYFDRLEQETHAHHC